MNRAQQLWLWLIRWPLAWLVQYGVTVEPDGDHDNKILAAYAWHASYRRQVGPLSIFLGAVLYHLSSFFVEKHLSVAFAAALSMVSYTRGWRFFPFIVIVSGVPFEDGDPQSYATFLKEFPGSSLQDWLFIEREVKTSTLMNMYSKARLFQFGHELREFMRVYGAYEGQYTLVSGYTDRAQHFVSPRACFRASVLEECRHEKDPFETYKIIVYSDWTNHACNTVNRWAQSDPFDASFECWCRDSMRCNRWMCLISGGPLSEVARLCELSNNVVSYAMAWSWDTSNNLFGQNANVLFDVGAAQKVVRLARMHIGVDTNFVKRFCPKFLGPTREDSFLEFKKQMGGRVDAETELMYRHFTQLGGPTPWSEVRGGYGTFYIYDMYAAILALQGGCVFEPAVLKHRLPSGNYMHDRGRVDVEYTSRFTRFHLTSRQVDNMHLLHTHLLRHMVLFFSDARRVK